MMTDIAECGVSHPDLVGVSCTQAPGHDFQHVSFDYPLAGQWDAEDSEAVQS